MATDFTSIRLYRAVRLVKTFLAVLALLIQPLVPLHVPMAFASVQAVTLVNENFNSYDGTSETVPPNWAFTDIGYYDTSSSSATPNSLKFDSDTSMAAVSYTLSSLQSGQSLSFWLKGNKTSGSTVLTVQQSINGIDWTNAESYSSADIPTKGTIMTTELLPATVGVRFIYTKDKGNIALDNVIITGQPIIDTTPPATPSASPPPGTYNSPQTVAISSTDDSGAVPTIYYTTDGSDPNRLSQKYTTPITVVSNETIKAIAYDATGNASEIAVLTYVITPDASFNCSNADSCMGTPTTAQSVTVTMTASEPLAATPDGWTATDNPLVFTRTYNRESDNGAHSVMISDAAGNTNTLSYTVAGIDRTPPTIALSGTAMPGTSNYQGVVNYQATDNAGSVSVTINGDPVQNSGIISTIGQYTITATDGAGNSTSVTFAIVSGLGIESKINASSIPLKPELPLHVVATSVPPQAGISAINNLQATPILNQKTAPTPTDDAGQVLGASTNDLKKSAVSEHSVSRTLRLLGLSWYWWVLIVAGIISFGGLTTRWWRH